MLIVYICVVFRHAILYFFDIWGWSTYKDPNDNWRSSGWLGNIQVSLQLFAESQPATLMTFSPKALRNTRPIVQIGHFWDLLGNPGDIFMDSQLTIWDMKYNFKPIWGAWNHLWSIWHFRTEVGHFWGSILKGLTLKLYCTYFFVIYMIFTENIQQTSTCSQKLHLPKIRGWGAKAGNFVQVSQMF